MSDETQNKLKPKEITSTVFGVAERLNITDILHKFPYEVSGGQKQRAAIARAIVNNQQLILADESTGALDSKASKTLLEIMGQMNRDLNSTILMVTHDAYSASHANRVLFLKDGGLFNEIYKGNKTKREFFNEILDVLALLVGKLALRNAKRQASNYMIYFVTIVSANCRDNSFFAFNMREDIVIIDVWIGCFFEQCLFSWV